MSISDPAATLVRPPLAETSATDHPRLADAIELLAELVGFDTVSTRSNRALIERIDQWLSQRGITSAVKLTPDGEKAVLLANIGPDLEGGVLLSGHTDVVEVADQDWDTPPFELHRKGDRLHGRGSCDMKGFIACAMAMAPEFAGAGLKRPVQLAFSRDEEIGCLGSCDLLELIDQSGLHPEVAIVGEPTGMQVVAGHKGGLVAHTEFHGVPAHSSLPDEGVSAIPFAARFICHLTDLEAAMAKEADPASPFCPGHGTINPGIIAGGTALNIFAAKCRLSWHYRSMPDEDLDRFIADIEGYLQSELLPGMTARWPGAGLDHQVEAAYPGLKPLAESPALALSRELTGSTKTSVLSIGTEAGYFQQAGISSVVLGPGDIAQAHKPNEFVDIDQLNQCLHFLDRLCERLSA